MLKTVTKQELQADLSRVIAQMEEGQDLLVMDGATPLARLSSVGYGATTEISDTVRINFSAFELPFP
jgi:antitoxin (DNA-binding transcriptional repressor) of toxin-antitoxin stability system